MCGGDGSTCAGSGCNDMDCGDQDCFDSTNGVGKCVDNCATKNCEDHQTCEMLATPCAAPPNDGTNYWCYQVAVCMNPGFLKLFMHTVCCDCGRFRTGF